FRLPGVTFFCISDTLVPTTYLVDTTLSNSSDSDQTVQAVRLLFLCIGLMFATVVMAYLLASVIVYFKINTFDFNWSEALPDAFRVGGVGGTILGLGLWIKAKLQERK
ncbi:hypothetical protein, partial [Escherichia coli]|uniref:hypothetical protein n=2 Tax=Escherichia coli TaxID=562 RepID=UPI00207B8181